MFIIFGHHRIQIKTVLRFHLFLVIKPMPRKRWMTKAGEHVGKEESLSTAGGRGS